MGRSDGFTILEVLIGIAVFSIVAGTVYSAFAGVLEIAQTAQVTSAALSIMESRLEAIRNMRYEDIGTIGGIPAGTLTQQQDVTLGNATYTLRTFVRDIDDPFDGTLRGTPPDRTPADYKLVQLSVQCTECSRTTPLTMATYVAPKTLEDASKRGSLLVQVIDASGILVAGATVHVTNPNVLPVVDYTDTTDANGQLWLLSVATSSAGYRVEATKEGYSTDRTYAPGSPANPLRPDVTVAAQQLSVVTLSIDRVSSLTVRTRDRFCSPVPGFTYTITGTKLIGTAPNVPKFTASRSSDATGNDALNTLEWDSYRLSPLIGGSRGLAGVSASLSLNVDPATAHSYDWRVASRSGAGLLVRVQDASGAAIADADVTVSGPSVNRAQATGWDSIIQHAWPVGSYEDATSNINVSSPGFVTLLANSGRYATGSNDWLTSLTYDLGTTSAKFGELRWGASVPSGAGPDAVRLQLAGNTDGLSWNYVGPDGTPTTFFAESGVTAPSFLAGSRYLRYRLYLGTQSPVVAPTVSSISLDFSSGCLPEGQVFIDGLAVGQQYTVQAARQGFATQSVQVTPSSLWQQLTIILTPP